MTPRTTPLHSSHIALGARMIDFGGWDMPVYYAGINEEHRAVRAAAGVFDVSHMGQVDISGPGAEDFLQRMLSNDLGRIGDGQAQYTLLTTSDGGIVDDLIAYRRGADDFLLVVNASNTDADVAVLAAAADGVTVADRSAEHGMIALQGPASDDVLDGQVADIPPFAFAERTVAGVPCVVARTGYTGERGVEIVTPAGGTLAVWEHLLAHGAVPCGLGARDTLRLEVCYPLHGNDISPTTNAIEAGLGWVCALAKDFTGAPVLRRTKAEGPARRLVAFRMTERAIPRGAMPILDGDGAALGTVTSGTLSPSLDEGIGMGYVRSDHAGVGSAIVIDVRGRPREAVVAKKPLYTKES
jgi:glycine cleavage system T protein (aminomethyltransferase)